tara:strand:- start:2796 stop:3461 length:666 start_codon:yes stop_codon:yes gene_type:complete
MHKLFRNYFSDQDLILFEQPREYIQQASISKGQAASYDTSRIAEAKVFDPYRDLPIELLDKVHDAVMDTKDYDSGYEFLEPWSVQTYHDYQGGKFDWHIDRLNYYMGRSDDPEKDYLKNIAPQREMSISVGLNDREEYEGGQFILDVGDGKKTPVDLDRGDMVIFDSDTYHGVEPVTKGTREALIIWLVHRDKFIEWKEEVNESEHTDLFPEGINKHYESI